MESCPHTWFFGIVIVELGDQSSDDHHFDKDDDGM